MSDDAIISFAQRLRQRDDIAVGNVGSSLVPPDKAARANALAEQFRVPPDFAERNLDALNREAERSGTVDLVARYPEVSGWLSNPRNAAVAQDDLGSLRKVAQTLRRRLPGQDAMDATVPPAATFRNFFSGVWENFIQGGIKAKAGLNAVAADVMPNVLPRDRRAPQLGDFGFDNAMSTYQRADARADAATPDFKSRTMRGLFSGVSSTAQMVPAVGLGLIAGPEAGLAALAAPVGFDAYAKYRGRGATPTMAGLGGAGEAVVEAATEALPMGFLVKSLGKVGFKPFVAGLLGREVPGEQIATFAQDAIDTAIANPDKTWAQFLAERPDAAYETFIATLVPGVLAGGASEVARAAHLREQAAQAETDAAFLDQLATGVTSSKIAKRDPSAFAKFLELQAQGSPVENVYIPAERIAEFFQSEGMDYRGDESPFSFDGAIADQVDEALATGGDVVIPTSDFATHLAGTPAWEALKDHVRLSPGGLSLAEARDAAAAEDGAREQMGEDFARQSEEQRAGDEPRDRLYQAVRDKLTSAGFTQSAADTNAALVTARYATRAARKGEALTGGEFDAVEVNQVLPERLAPIVAADQLDLVIDAMKRDKAQRSAGQKFGPSLLEWISTQGGIEDKGGDLASMGAATWHQGKVGRRKLIRPVADDSPTLVPIGKQNVNTPDELALRAQEAGYFPVGERPSLDALREAIDAELRGKPVYAEDRSGTTDQVREAADELAALLDQEGLDPATASKGDIRKAVERYQAERMTGRGYDQANPVATITGEEIAPKGTPTADLRKAARTWYDENLKGQSVKSGALGRDVIFAKSKKAFSASADPRKIHAFAALRELIAKAPLIETTAPADPSVEPTVRAYHYLEAPVRIGDEIQIVGVTIREDANGDLYYNHSIREGTSPGPLAPRLQSGAWNQGTSLDQSIPENGDGINLSVRAFADGPRGRITFPGDGRSIIDLFQARDPSTFLHESAHLWLEELRADAEAEGASEQARTDWLQVKLWFTDNRVGMTDGTIPVDAHELWARGVERFVMEGKAPSSALRRVFDTFRSWLVSIYQVVGNLRSPITPEIRDVMSRLIATDVEIEEARDDQYIKALWSTAVGAGMSEPVFAEYQKLVGEARDEAHDALLFKTMASIRRERTKAWRDERDAVRAEVAARIDARPEFRALALMRSKEARVRLDRGWLVETYGEDALALLPKAVPPIFADRETTGADDIAEMSGFETGDELVRTLMSVGARTAEMRAAGDERSVRQAMIEDETAAVMRDRHGDPLSDGSIEEEALTLIHNDRQGEVIAAELRELGKRSNRRPTPYALARQWAAETISQSKVADSLSGAALQRYARAARNAAKLAEEAMLAGNVDETFRQKQRQMLNNALIAEAGKAKALIDAAAARLAKIAKRATMKSVDQDYLDQAHGLLEQVDFRARSQRSIDRQESFESWAAARQAEGFDVAVPPSFAATLGKEHWSRLSVEKLLGLRDAVDQVIHLGRLKQTLLDGKEKRDRGAVIVEAVAGMGGLKQRPPSDLMEPSRWDAIRSRISSIDGALLKMETVFDWLDGGNSNGAFNRVVFRRIAEAQDRQAAMMSDYLGRLNGLIQAIPKKQIARWSEKVSAPELLNRETGRPWQMTRDQLVAMALNMGNAGNRQRLADGYGWSEAGIMSALNRELSAEDWQYVQAVWDTIDGLWPEIAALEKRLNGIEPEKVEAVPLETAHGALRGGYYPAIYDPAKSYAAETNAALDSDALFGSAYTKATTTASATKARADKVKRPIHLSLGIINRHVAEVIHDVTHREAVIDADRFLSDPKIMAAIDGTLGPEIRKQFRPWLQHIANEMASDRTGNAGFEWFLKKMRTNATLVGMGFRASTALMQVAGYANSTEVVGERYMALGLARFARNPIEASRFVLDRSGEVRNRMDTLDRDIRDTIRREAGGWALMSNAKRFAFHHIGYMDRMVVVPTWIGAYNKAIDGGLPEEDAGYAADKAVRQSQGAGAAKDLAAVQRGKGKAGEAMKLLTMFYSYMSAVYQRQRTLTRDVMGADSSRARNLPKLISRTLWLAMIPPVLSELLVGRGPDDDEDAGLWALQKMLLQSVGPLPVVRDIAGALSSGFGYKFTPAARGIETLINSFKDVERLIDGEGTKRATRNVLETVGYFTGLIPGQVASSTQFMVDVAQGDQDPDSVFDWIEGLSTGKIDED